MAGLSPAEIAYPIRTILAEYKNISVLMSEVLGIDLNTKTIHTTNVTHSYDFLITACGAQHSYFGRYDWEEFAPGLKSIEQATEIRRRVLQAFERAEAEPVPDLQKTLLTFVVIGGGPTGVELAGALGEISRFCINHEFKHIDPTHTRIILLEGGPRILPSYDPELSQKAMRALEQLGVQVWTKSRATEVNATGVQVGNEFINATTILWAAGIEASSLGESLGTPLDHAGRVEVNEFCQVVGYPEVFVIGDQAHFTAKDGTSLPGLAPVAAQQGDYVAKVILQKTKASFHYQDKGQMATIGRRKAVVQAFGLKIGGTLAWYTWLLVHIYYLIGFKNRIFVLYQWAWSYFTYKRGARLIIAKNWKLDGDDKNAH